jgi:hypothetical protein
MMRPEHLDGFAAVASFSDERHIRLNRNQTGDPPADDRVVIHS